MFAHGFFNFIFDAILILCALFAAAALWRIARHGQDIKISMRVVAFRLSPSNLGGIRFRAVDSKRPASSADEVLGDPS